MSQISKQGAVEVRNNVERPLRAIWSEIEKAGLGSKCKDAYSHIFKFLDDVDAWDTNIGGTPEPKIVVNGKEFTPRGK